MPSYTTTDVSDSRFITLTPDPGRWPLLTPDAWRGLRRNHEQRIDTLLGDYLERRSRHERDPVPDFLFEYYSFRPAQLRRWSPGIGRRLVSAAPSDLPDGVGICQWDGSKALDPRAFPKHRIGSLHWMCALLEATHSRSPRLGCYGLHEWAMVYRTEAIRHPYLPLRLDPEAINTVVEEQSIVCSHYDAYRFFTRAAAPLNELKPTRGNRTDFEQPGCIHTTMDLYKWAYKIYPWVPSELLADCFALALSARKTDMQASPYDLREYGLAPIRIETPQGRQRYNRLQKELYERAAPLRKQLITVYRTLLDCLSAGK